MKYMATPVIYTIIKPLFYILPTCMALSSYLSHHLISPTSSTASTTGIHVLFGRHNKYHPEDLIVELAQQF